MGTYRGTPEGRAASLRHGRIFARAMEIDKGAFTDAARKFKTKAAEIQRRQTRAYDRAAIEIEAEELAANSPLTQDSQKGITNP